LKVEFKSSFARDIKKVKDKPVLKELKTIIDQVKRAAGLHEINNLKQLKGEGKYFRIRMGEYRIGLVVQNDVVNFVRFLHRREIYRHFPF